MNAGRRILLAFAFLGLACLLVPSARAQDGQHRMWESKLTPEQLKAALARLGDGGDNLDQFRDQITNQMKAKGMSKEDISRALELIKKHPELLEQAKRFAKQRRTEPGRPGQLTPDDMKNLFQVKPGEPFRVPDPKNFKPAPTPPVQPGMGDPPPQPNVPPPPGNTEAPPAGGFTPPEAPKTGNEKKPISLDENPFAQTENADPRAKSLEAFAAVWERNIGPLSETPEVRKALLDLVGENGLDFDFKDDKGNSLWDLMKNGDGSDFGDLFNGASSGGGSWFGDWDFPKFSDWFGGGGGSSSSSSWNWGRWGSSSSSSSSRSGSGFGSGGGGFGFGGDLPWIPFVVLLVIILAVVIWFQVKNIDIHRSAIVVAADGLGPWPVDPRQINTREEVVKAFEYLSVLICGPSARNWTHNTIADALSDLATTHGETAVMLARLYELARYAPIDEPLSNDELIEARKLVCSLAGVSY